MAEFDLQSKNSDLQIESIPLSTSNTVLTSAIELYRRGLNVFPVLRPEMIRELSMKYPSEYNAGEKRPYILQPLFTSRMHLCDEHCLERERKTDRKCQGSNPDINFKNLFFRSNLAVMLGRTSSNMVCVDCDSVDAFKYVHTEFRNRDLDFWAFQTSRGGNLLFQVEEHQIDNQPKKQNSEIEIWGSSHFCVLPPSVHDSGVFYTWLKVNNPFSGPWMDGGVPRLSVEDLDWLGIGNRRHHISSSIDNLPTWVRMLSNSNQKILTETLIHGSRNSQLVKPLYEIAALILNGLISKEDGLEVLIKAASQALPPYSEEKVRHMLRSAMKKKDLSTSFEYFTGSQRSNIWSQALGFADTYNWGSHGRTALTDLAVFKACCERCRMDLGQPFRASVREISELANISSLFTTTKAMRRLKEHGLIEHAQKTSGGAFSYIFGKSLSFGSEYINTTCNTSVLTTIIEKSNDLIRKEILDDIFGKLGRVSRICWEHLIVNPERNISTLAKETKLNYQSVYYNIPRLKQMGFISWSEAEGLFIGEDLSNEELSKIARSLGVVGKARNRKRDHQVEREIRVNQEISKNRSRLLKMFDASSVK